MFRRGLVAMTARLLLCVAFVGNILVLVACTETTEVKTASQNVSSTNEETSSSSYESLSSSAMKFVESKPKYHRETTESQSTEVSSANTTSSSSYYTSSSSSSEKTVVTSKPKCRRVHKCPKNEEFSAHPESIQRAQHCSEKAGPSTYRSTSSKPYVAGCVCKENYLRAENGTCIPAAQCPVTCGANEILDNCPTDCQSDYCPTEEDKGAKPCIRPDVCPPPVCRCAFNHRRASNGSCIPTRECPPFACGTNEEYNPCPPLCPTDDCSQASPSGECPPQFGRIGIILPCNPKCRCIKDFWRLDGICVPYGQCPGVCPANERYSTCKQAECRALNCTQKGQSIACIRMDPQYCEKGCVCKEGYLRNNDGICVLEDKCEPAPSCNSPNEEFIPCIQGVCRAKNCSQKGENVPCPDIPKEKCNSGCICKEHFLRAANGSCVPEDQCEPPKTCGENEVLDSCSLSCNSDNCPKSADEKQVCTQSNPCVPACKCKFNYKRSENGTCIPTRDCPPFDCSAKPNEEFVACPPFCPTDECGKPRLEGRCPFKIGTFLQCNPKCQCKDGYGRVNGTCVPFDKCPGLCPTNEMYSSCVQRTCRQQNCSNRDVAMKSCPSCDEASCQRGCVCQENYYRNAKGVCVPYHECEAPKTCSENEVLVNCSMTCNSDNCPQSADEKQVCTQADPCVPACKCKFNYKRAVNGTCIPTRDCPPFVCGTNEEYNPCPPLCPTDDCSQASPSGECPPKFGRIGIILPCNPKCRCIKDFWRLDGICVPYGQCPGVCPANERYSTCKQAECRALNCTQKGKSIACIRMDPQYCEKGCVCKEGYLRNNDGICVLEDKCKPAPSCSSPNEEFVPCMQGVCRAKNCSQKGEAVPCPDIPQEKCDSGCICKEHFLRAANGSCVPEDQCEPPKTCGENEVLDSCSLSCNSDNCPKSADEKQVCTQSNPCVPACKCKFNYKRSENGTCIPTRDCPPFDCSAKPNEEFVACPPFCPTDECGKPRLEGRCPFKIGTFLQCNPKCQCKDGYGRVNGTCVPFDKCPGLCPTNEVYSSCVQRTCRQQNCSNRDVAMKNCPSCDEASCQRGCVCQENYYRNAKGVCVPYHECEAPKTCRENEVLVNCSMTCNSDNCPQSADEKQVCTQADPCVPACKCRFNYKRAVNGTCIPTRDCPPFDCSAKPNEEYVACPPLCPTDECGTPRLEGRCPFRIGIILTCHPKCQCKDGYGRVNGTCVPFEKCPGLCRTNEVYSSCIQKTCRQQKCSDRDLAMESCPSCDEASCQRGCVCKPNYYRNDKGVCVSYKECGGPMCPNAHEDYTKEFRECPPNTCNSLVARITCDQNQKVGPGCVCEYGYLRLNATSPCIPICDCPEMKNSPDCA